MSEHKDHPCFKCGREGMGGAYYDFPHPAIKCNVDGHRALDIIGMKHCLDTLYEECPLKCDKFKPEEGEIVD